MDIAAVGEFRMLEFIRRLTASQKDRRLLLGPGDDCCLLRPSPGRALVLTTDEMVEGTHFLMNRSTPELVARHLARINLSDMAGMGAAVPVSALCGAGLPRTLEWDWVRRFTRALMAELNAFGVTLAGGNLARSDSVHVYLTLSGEARPSETVRRDTARPGDLIFGLGDFGLARAGLELVLAGKAGARKKLAERFWLPRIQLEAGAAIGKKHLASAMMDNSDGLYKSVKTLAAASGCGAMIRLEPSALSPELARYCAAKGADWRDYVLSGGEDFGLVLTVSPRRAGRFLEFFPRACALGVMTRGRKVLLHDNCKPHGFEHF